MQTEILPEPSGGSRQLEPKAQRPSRGSGLKTNRAKEGGNMREIKFRSWDKKIKQMFPAFGVNQNPVGINLLYLPGCEFMQYTGLKDKTSKEIYEGDLVKYRDWEDDVVALEWNDDTASFEFVNGESFDEVNLSQLEIVGNIYQNPKLQNTF
jgi:hypothetical protein